MAIRLRVIQRSVPNETGERLWYPVQYSASPIDEDQIAEEIADDCSLDEGEVIMVLRRFRKIMTKQLLSGNTVRLGNWGIFGVRVSAEGSNAAEDVSLKNIREVRLRFRPGSKLKEELQKASYMWL